MDRALVATLRARGVDVLTAFEAAMIERDDSEHLAFAARQQRILITCNVGDFCRLHSDYAASGQSHAGIVCMQQQSASIGDTLRRMLRLLNSLSADDMTNRIEFLSRWSV